MSGVELLQFRSVIFDLNIAENVKFVSLLLLVLYVAFEDVDFLNRVSTE